MAGLSVNLATFDVLPSQSLLPTMMHQSPLQYMIYMQKLWQSDHSPEHHDKGGDLLDGQALIMDIYPMLLFMGTLVHVCPKSGEAAVRRSMQS